MFHSNFKLALTLCITFFVFGQANADVQEKKVKVALRSIGHEFLMQMNDSTSRILPIEKDGKRYAIRFENPFSFEPDLLFFAAFKVAEESKLIKSYIVEVEQCATQKVVHSFEVGSTKDIDKIACKHRALPYDCYVFYFTLTNQPHLSLTEKSSSLNWNYLLIALAMGASALVYFLVYKVEKKATPSLIHIGQYQLDQKGMKLLFNKKTTELSSKETDLLFFLISNENKTLERDEILNIVWQDEGNYVGRTLDVYISKLRKKLEADSRLKIINVRGVGYRFVIHQD